MNLLTVSRIVALAARALDNGGRILMALPVDDHILRGRALHTLGEFGFSVPQIQVDGGEARIRTDRGPRPIRS